MFPRSLLGSLLTLAACSSNSTTDQPLGKAQQAPAPTTSPVPAAAPALIDQKNGFRGHHFGATLAQFPDLQLSQYQLDISPNQKEYEMPPAKANLHVGETQLSVLNYSFFKGQFYQVSLTATGPKAMGLLAALTSLYGPPTQPNLYKRVYWWHGQQASARFEQKGGDAPSATIWSNALRQQLEADQQAATQQAGHQASRDL
jgi:hypothetical protein